MWPRFTIDELRTIGHYLGGLILFSTIVYLIPFATALVFREWEPASRYLIAIGVNLVIGMAFYYLRIQPVRLTRRQALIVTGLAWVVLAVIATIPLYMSGHYARYLDALFDGVSGYTTTGATLILDLDHLSNADNMLRFMMQLTGGLGLIVIAMSFGLFGRAGGASLYSSEGRSEHVVPNLVQTARFIGRIAVAFIFLGTVIMTCLTLFKGFEPARAVMQSFWLAISGFITGGYAPTSQSVFYYHCFPMEVVLMVLMLFGAINFMIQSELWKGRLVAFLRDIEVIVLVVWLFVMTTVFALAAVGSPTFGALPALLRRGVFMVVSCVTTTGLQNITSNEIATVLTGGSLLVLALIMAVGGGAGSTAGGIKLNRLGIIAMTVVSTVKEALSPDSARVVVTYHHAGERKLTEGVAKEAMTIFVLYVLTYVLGALAGIAAGYDALHSTFQSIAIASNGGLVVGIVSPGMPTLLEIFYIFEMWAGRLEFITLLALIVQVFTSLVPRRRRESM